MDEKFIPKEVPLLRLARQLDTGLWCHLVYLAIYPRELDESSIVRPILNYDVLVSGGGVRVSDVTRGEGVWRHGAWRHAGRGKPFNYVIN